MENQIDIRLQKEDLNLQLCYDFVQEPDCGGISLFVGTVRNSTAAKKVEGLEFSAYAPMAIKEMKKIAEEAIRSFQIKKIAIHHGLGSMGIGEIPVIIATASPH